MPYHWTRISTGTPDELKGLSPGKFKRKVHEKVKREGAALDELYFAPERGEAWAMIHVPEGQADLGERLRRSFESDEAYDLVVAEEMPADWQSGGGGEQAA